MFPLIFIVLGLGAVLTAYELSPRARSRINDYVRALREAHTAHRVADVHLANANTAATVAVQHAQTALAAQQEAAALPVMPAQAPAPVPASVVSTLEALARAAQRAVDAAVDHTIAATVANQQAAQSTADAAKSSQSVAERTAAADSAARVLEREKKITAALASLGVGQCGARAYPRVTPQIRDEILAKLHAEGMTVTGDNPWDIDTQQAGVRLRAVWDPREQVLRLIVTASAAYAPCVLIWDRIDPKLRGIIGT